MNTLHASAVSVSSPSSIRFGKVLGLLLPGSQLLLGASAHAIQVTHVAQMEVLKKNRPVKRPFHFSCNDATGESILYDQDKDLPRTQVVQKLIKNTCENDRKLAIENATRVVAERIEREKREAAEKEEKAAQAAREQPKADHANCDRGSGQRTQDFSPGHGTPSHSIP